MQTSAPPPSESQQILRSPIRLMPSFSSATTDTVAHLGHANDHSLRWLLILQVLTVFVAIPIAALHPVGFVLADLCRLGFAIACIRLFTRRLWVHALLVAALMLMVVFPAFGARLGNHWNPVRANEFITLIVMVFNVTVTVLVARYVFGPGRVSADRVLGAVLIYLSVAALFANFYVLLVLLEPSAISGLSPLKPVAMPDQRAAELTYFSLSTITSTGWGDLMPLHPVVRSLANLEAVVGQLFPATLVARLVGLHLAHRRHDAKPHAQDHGVQ